MASRLPQMSSPLFLAAILSIGWIAGFVGMMSPTPTREWQTPLRISLNHWPDPCTEIFVGGGALPPVKIDLGLAVTAWPDPLHLEFGLARAAFESRVRQQIEWLRHPSLADSYYPATYREAALAEYHAAFRASRLARLYQTYLRVERRTKTADALHVVHWLLGLMVPPIALCLVGLILRRRTDSDSSEARTRRR